MWISHTRVIKSNRLNPKVIISKESSDKIGNHTKLSKLRKFYMTIICTTCVKFIYSVMATQSKKNTNVFYVMSNWLGFFFKFRGLLRIFELYIRASFYLLKCIFFFKLIFYQLLVKNEPLFCRPGAIPDKKNRKFL